MSGAAVAICRRVPCCPRRNRSQTFSSPPTSKLQSEQLTTKNANFSANDANDAAERRLKSDSYYCWTYHNPTCR